jgi:hypothetical protein
VPLLSVARHFVDRAPSALTIDALERYRGDAARMLEHVRPVIERAAGLSLESWAAQTFEEPDLTEIVDELADGFELTGGHLPDAMLDGEAPACVRECIPLLAVALEMINRGPAAVTIVSVEHYRMTLMNLIDQIQPAVEQAARRELDAWTKELQAA